MADLGAAALAALLFSAAASYAVAQETLDAPVAAAAQPGMAAPEPFAPQRRHHKRKPVAEADTSVPHAARAVATLSPPPGLSGPPGPLSAPPPGPPPTVTAPGTPVPPPPASDAVPEAEHETDAALLVRLCTKTLRHNEEDRVYGLISLSLRLALSQQRSKYSAEAIDDAIQQTLAGLMRDCPRIVATDEAHRLGMVIGDIQNIALQRLAAAKQPEAGQAKSAALEEPAEDGRSPGRGARDMPKASAADLSQQLTSWEIDAWLDGLPPLQRALALFQYASDVTPKDIADALGISEAMVTKDNAFARNRVMAYLDERDDGAAAAGPGPALQYRIAGVPVAGLLRPDTDAAEAGPAGAGPRPALRIGGISTDLYAGWSLLATATGKPPDKGLDVSSGPIVVETVGNGQRRLIVTAADEISKPTDPVRRFLLKAYTIDGDSGGAGFHDALRLSTTTVDSPAALRTLRNANLSNIEIARCLWHDYGAAPDPGLCR